MTWKDVRDKFYWWRFQWHIRGSDDRRLIQGFSWYAEIFVTPLPRFGLDERSGCWYFHLGWVSFWWLKDRRHYTKAMRDGNPVRKRRVVPE